MKTSFEQLTISERDRIATIINMEGVEDIEKDLSILKILGFDYEDHSWSETESALESAKFLLTEPKVKKVKEFEYNGYKFKAPSVDDINYSQYVDLCNSRDNVGLLHAILVPVGHKYNTGYDIDFSYLPYLTAKSIIDPFLTALVGSSTRWLRYSLRVLKVMTFFKPSLKRVSSILDTGSLTLSELCTKHWV